MLRILIAENRKVQQKTECCYPNKQKMQVNTLFHSCNIPMFPVAITFQSLLVFPHTPTCQLQLGVDTTVHIYFTHHPLPHNPPCWYWSVISYISLFLPQAVALLSPSVVLLACTFRAVVSLLLLCVAYIGESSLTLGAGLQN